MPPDILAVDFGTSNSAAAILRDGAPVRLPIETGKDTIPTAVFFPAGRGAMKIGSAATDALIDGIEGRYMRALKSVLGTSLLQEPRRIGGQRRTLADSITAFLADLKQRAEQAAGQRFTRVLSGRPVHFHSNDPMRDTQAEADLRACYLQAGFAEVRFLAEPEAAALACRDLGEAGTGAQRAGGGTTGLIVDIGGGTSDFSVFRAQGGRVTILASHGVRLGGTDFDQAVSLAHAMPLMGLGGTLRRDMGAGLLPMPSAIFADLANWAKIPFLYTPETRKAVDDMLRHAVDPRAVGRLAEVLRHELGHGLAFAVERGKIGANMDDAGPVRIDMTEIEPGLGAPVTAASLDAALARHGTTLEDAMQRICAQAGLAPGAIDRVILVGGSSLMRVVAAAARDVFPAARMHSADPFTAVVDGLALATGTDRFT